jgi:hypothetical protein
VVPSLAPVRSPDHPVACHLVTEDSVPTLAQ